MCSLGAGEGAGTSCYIHVLATLRAAAAIGGMWWWCRIAGWGGGALCATHTHTRILGSLNWAKRRARNRKVVASIPGAGMSGGGRRQPCVKGILSGETAE